MLTPSSRLNNLAWVSITPRILLFLSEEETRSRSFVNIMYEEYKCQIKFLNSLFLKVTLCIMGLVESVLAVLESTHVSVRPPRLVF